MKIILDETARDDYLYWQTQEKKTLSKINRLIKDRERNGYSGIGKPEPLKYEFRGYIGAGTLMIPIDRFTELKAKP